MKLLKIFQAFLIVYSLGLLYWLIVGAFCENAFSDMQFFALSGMAFLSILCLLIISINIENKQTEKKINSFKSKNTF